MAVESREPNSGAFASVMWLTVGVGVVGLTLVDQRGLVFPSGVPAPTAMLAMDGAGVPTGSAGAAYGGTNYGRGGPYGTPSARTGSRARPAGGIATLSPARPAGGMVILSPAAPLTQFASAGFPGGAGDGGSGGFGFNPAPVGFPGGTGVGGVGGGGGGGGNPDNPTNPGQPGTPTDPTNPGQPGIPTDPGTPGQPGNPVDPGTPGQPGNPVDPGNPNPGNPDPGEPPVTAVPEPGVWLLMIGGIGMIGGALRRRRFSSARDCRRTS